MSAPTSTVTERHTPEFIQSVIQEGIEEIGRFAVQPEFQALLEDLYARPREERPQFVVDVVLNPEEQARRGIVAPEGMVIQRSAFADGRPTLFCITKKVPLAYPWHKVTITFDSEMVPNVPAGAGG
jgi:hypothetical protein